MSTATVSRVLNGGAVTAPTAARVWETVTRLEYTPNALTRGIFAGRSRTIGVVIRMGRQAADLVVESPGETVTVLVEPSLVARSSCGEAQESREVLRERRRADGRHDQ